MCGPRLFKEMSQGYVQRDMTITSLRVLFVGPEMQSWIKTSKDPYLVAF